MIQIRSVLRDLPGIRELVVAGPIENKWSLEKDRFQARCDERSRALFGVVLGETKTKRDSALGEMGIEVGDQWYPLTREQVDEFELPFDLYNQAPPAEKVAAFAAAGWDVKGDDGEPVWILAQFERQLIAAIAGLVPGARITTAAERAEADAEAWGKWLRTPVA